MAEKKTLVVEFVYALKLTMDYVVGRGAVITVNSRWSSSGKALCAYPQDDHWLFPVIRAPRTQLLDLAATYMP